MRKLYQCHRSHLRYYVRFRDLTEYNVYVGSHNFGVTWVRSQWGNNVSVVTMKELCKCKRPIEDILCQRPQHVIIWVFDVTIYCIIWGTHVTVSVIHERHFVNENVFFKCQRPQLGKISNLSDYSEKEYEYMWTL